MQIYPCRILNEFLQSKGFISEPSTFDLMDWIKDDLLISVSYIGDSHSDLEVLLILKRLDPTDALFLEFLEFAKSEKFD